MLDCCLFLSPSPLQRVLDRFRKNERSVPILELSQRRYYVCYRQRSNIWMGQILLLVPKPGFCVSENGCTGAEIDFVIECSIGLCNKICLLVVAED